MASIANTVTLSTDLNVDPYYDDFNESKNFHRILFRPGLAVQARELTQIQSILQNQIDRFAEHVFKEGSIIRGCQTLLDNNVMFIKLRDRTSNGITSVNVYSFLNKTITGSTSGVSASVIQVNDGSEANTPNFKTLFVKLTGANGTTRLFSNGEIITASGGGNITANLISSAAIGFSAFMKIASGIIYAKDHFIRTDEDLLALSKYSTDVSVRVGFNIIESIIKESDDFSLLDPASGSYNYAAPGAARLKLEAKFAAIGLNEAGGNNFIEITQLKDGIIQSRSDSPQYGLLRDYFAKRTYDESGNYVVRGLIPRLREHLSSGNNQGVFPSADGGSATKLVVELNPGKAYVQGYDIETLQSARVEIDKANDFASVSTASAVIDYGNYVLVDNIAGGWGINSQALVSLRAQQANSVSTLAYSTTNFPSTQIGTARVRSIEYYSGTPGLPSAQYKLYLTDINMNSGFGFQNVQFIGFNAGSGQANGKADILGSNGLNANTAESSFEKAVFKLPAKFIRRLRNTSGTVVSDFRFKKSFDMTFGTAGTATVTTGLASETFSGSGGLSASFGRANYYVVARGSGNTAAISTLRLSTTSGSNTITRSNSSIDLSTRINPGDLIRVANTGDFIVTSVSATSLTTLSTASASRTNMRVHKLIKQGQVLDFGGQGGLAGAARTITVSSPTQTDFDLKETLGSSINATVIAELNKVDGQEASKTVNRNQLVQIRIGAGGGTSYIANTTGPWPLGISDGFKLVSVRRKTGSNFTSLTEGTDVTNSFVLDSGMNDNYYSHAQLVKRPGAGINISSGDRLLVKLDYFTHSYSTGVGYFSIDSYPIDDANAGTDTTKIYTYEVPRFVSQRTGLTYDLRDSIDIRPRMTDTANTVTSLTNISINPRLSTLFDQPSGGLRFMSPGDTFTTDLDYFLYRNDRIVLDRTGVFSLVRGVPSNNPITPDEPLDSMSVATINLSPYPSLPDEQARRVGRADLASKVFPIKNPRFTMKDIGILRDRIENLEYYTTLNLLEMDTKNLLIRDEEGNNRFKNGILVDPFHGHNIGDVTNSDYKISIDAATGQARPPFKLDNFELFYNAANSSNVVRTNTTVGGVARDQIVFISNSAASFVNGQNVIAGGASGILRFKVNNKLYIENATANFSTGSTVTSGTASSVISGVYAIPPGDLITLPYTHEIFISQPFSSTTKNAAGLFWRWGGRITLNPDSDYWLDTVQLPDVNVNVNNFDDNWAQRGAWGTAWNDWQTVWQSSSDAVVNDTTVSTQGDATIATTVSTTTTTTTSGQNRSGIQYSLTPVTSTVRNGPRVVSTNIQPFMRSRLIRFTATGVKPGARLYAFFDGTAVSDYVTPTNSLFASIANEGGPIFATANGNAYGIFRIPADERLRFRTGTLRFRLSDSLSNDSAQGSSLTAAEGSYTALGLTQQTQDTIVTTRNPQVIMTAVSESRVAITNAAASSITAVSASVTQNITNVTNVTNNLTNVTNIENIINNTVIENITNVTENIINQTIINVPNVVQEPPGPNMDTGGDGGGFDGYSDPIAQSFSMNTVGVGRVGGSGAFVTKVDLFFATKDSLFGCEVHIRDIDTLSNSITPRVVPFSTVILQPAEINVSSDGSAPTPVYFSAPVYLQNGRDYAIIIKPIGNNPNTSLHISRLGEVDTLTGNRITTQPAAGMLFVSSNDKAYSAVQDEDLKFTLYVANFQISSVGSVVFKNELRDYLQISNASGAFIRSGEEVHGETILVGTFANTDTVNTGVTFVQGVTSGATGTISRFSSTQLRVRNVSLTSKFRGGEQIRIRNTNATTGVIVGNSSGGITSATTPIGRVAYYDSVSYANTYLHLANVSFTNSGPASGAGRVFFANNFIRGQVNGYTARIVKLDRLEADLINISSDFLTPTNTAILTSGKFATSNSARDTSFINLDVNNNTEFPTPRFILSRSMESNTSISGSSMAIDRSAELKSTLISLNRYASPVIDVQRISAIIVQNLINNDTTGEANTSSGGNALAKYITRKITLADGQDAEDIRVYLTAYRPPGSNINVYYKILHREDSDTFDKAKWIPMDSSLETGFASSATFSSSELKNDFREYVFVTPDFSSNYNSGANTTNSNIIEYRNSTGAAFVGYKYLSIKAVLTSTSTANPPRLDDIRVIALQR
jgi:hypothetical protein